MIILQWRGWLRGEHLAVIFASVFFFGAAFAGPPQAAVATAHPLATRAGIETLDRGGNAFDAAVAVTAALAVVEPAGSGLGGGGFWLLHRASDGLDIMLDGRERAPLAARRDMYLDREGRFVPELARDGPLSAAIPGMPAAIAHLAENYGRLPLRKSLAPAIRYASKGFKIGERHRRLLGFRRDLLSGSPAAAKVFLADGRVPGAAAVLVQKDLAAVLEGIGEHGTDGFYRGRVAEKLVEGVRLAGGIWTLRDLEQYRVAEREPVSGLYRGIRITSAAPPSSGGVVLLEALNILSGYDLDALDEITRKHLVIEAMRRAYHDRALYLGDPDFVEMPVGRLLDEDYAAGLRSSIRYDRALPSAYLSADVADKIGGQDTTHFSVIDRDGNRVGATLSVNFPFGSGFMPPNTGVVLNDEMDDFVGEPGEPNSYGLIGGAANEIAPGKRMLSSMTPTFLEDARRVAVLGTPGGSRIISMMLLAVLDFAAGGGADAWVWAPRFHHQYIPDVVHYEKGGLTDDEIEGLEKLGHTLKEVGYRYGDMHAVLWDKSGNTITAASDPRGEGLAVVR
ncbi:MAG: gamma-glutamyltransferase [Pseudomonadota bacterium]